MGGHQPLRGCQHTILLNFPKKMHEIEKILGCCGEGRGGSVMCDGVGNGSV